MKKILVIEDDPMIRLAYMKLLSRNGFEVTETDNAKTGLEKALDIRPDVIILDMIMPKMNGIEFMKQWNIFDAEKKTKVIVCSNSKVPEMIKEALELGAVTYLPKVDVSPKKVIQTINDVLRESKV